MIRDEMTINGKSIRQYNARLLDYSVSGTGRAYSQSSSGSILRVPIVYHTTLSPRTLSITITFFPRKTGTDSSRNNSIPERLSRSTDNIVQFESDTSNRVLEIGLPDGYIYKAVLQSCGTPSFDATGEQDVEYSFLAVRTKPAVKRVITAGGSVYCESNTTTPFRISFTVTSNAASMIVCGITINNITANTEILIDSELGIITADGLNKFDDTDLIEFPYLHPGSNTITCSIPGTEIAVVYTPIYV